MSDSKIVSTKLFWVLTDEFIEVEMCFSTLFCVKLVQNSTLGSAGYLTDFYH